MNPEGDFPRGLNACASGAYEPEFPSLKRRAAVDPLIGHLKTEHRIGRNNLAHRAGETINAVLTAVGYNFRLLLNWLRLLLRAILVALFGPHSPDEPLNCTALTPIQI